MYNVHVFYFSIYFIVFSMGSKSMRLLQRLRELVWCGYNCKQLVMLGIIRDPAVDNFY